MVNSYPYLNFRKLFFLPLIMSLILFHLSGCGLGKKVDRAIDQVDQTLEILDGAISDLNKANADWQLILQDTRDQLMTKGLTEAGNQVKQIIDRTTSDALVVEFCSIDFMRNRLIQELTNVKAYLLHQPVSTQLVPVICMIATDKGSTGIDLSNYPNFIQLTGYDMGTNLKVVVLESTGNFDITDYYNSGPYQASVTLGANGPSLTDNSRRIVFYWKDSNQELSGIGITRTKPPDCEVKEHYPPYTPVTPKEFWYNPPLIRGDAEFSGNGPTVHAQVQLVNLGDRVIAWVYMNARETETWGTTADGAMAFTIFTPPGGYQVLALNADPRTTFDYTDNNHELDPRQGKGGNFIDEASFIGDTDQDDVCKTVNCGWEPPHTGIKIEFNSLNFSLIQTNNCTPLVNNPPDEIDKKYASLTGQYGAPLGPELYTADGTGRMRQYERGWIYWTPSTGAHLIYGSIYEKWASMGFEAGLGYPVTDETSTADGKGRFNRFQGGYIYWTPWTGAHAVYGAIYQKWASMGAESGSLGYPVSDEYWGNHWIGGWDGNWSRISEFEHGWIVCKWGEGVDVTYK